ncbi:hypothetical protein ABHI18_006016 [Aspergillus niger]
MSRKRPRPSSFPSWDGLLDASSSTSSDMTAVTERHVAIARQLASYSEDALNLSRINRPENTSKAYNPKQKEWIDWVKRIGFPDGELVTEHKLVWFLKEEVLSREVRSCRYKKHRTTEEGEPIIRTLGKSSVQSYVSAIIDLWSYQKSSGINPNPNPRGEAVTALLDDHARHEYIRKRDQYLDRAAGTLLDGYDEKRIEAFVRYCWDGWAQNLPENSQRRKPQSIESHLRTVVDFLFSHHMITRGQSRRSLQFADLFTIPLKNEGPTPCFPMIMIMDNGKTNAMGRLEYNSVIRHRNPMVCTMAHSAFYLFFRWNIGREPVPRFRRRPQWYNLHLLKGESAEKPLSYDTQLYWINRVFAQVGLNSVKKTHIGRSEGARWAELNGVSENQIRRAGHWNNDALTNCYLTHLPRKFIRAMAGFEPSTRGNYYLPRAQIQPPESLTHALWPWVDEWLDWFESYGDASRQNEKESDSETEKVNEDDRQDMAAQGFLRLLVQLRIILLQDSVMFREQFPLHPIWSDPIFLRDDYEAFATEVKQSIRDVEEPEEVRLRQALPALAERLNHVRQDLQQGLGHAIKEWGSKTHLQLQEINNYLHDIMGGRVAFTLQAVDPDATKSFMSAVQSPRLIPGSISAPSAPSAVTAAAADGSGAVTVQETFESVPTPNHAGGIPHYVPFRTVHTVPELWREWTSGLGELPSAKTLRRRLRDAVVEQHSSQLNDLPEGAKVSLALDCWTSPFQQAFMAITAYFIDSDWNYRELLLGFEPLHGPHSGSNLSDVLLDLLRDRHLVDRIFTVTTDNATNNDTLVRGLQDVLLATGAINSRDSIIRVPCMAHVIQLCLKQLLGHIKAAPKNDEVSTLWSDSQASFLKDSADCGDVAHTLTKVRSLAVFVNASPQRRDAFIALQPVHDQLFPLQDVQTRWNSTFLMLRRARKLRNCIDRYCTDHDYVQFKISDTEWRQIDYLLQLTKPFFQFTMALMKTRDVTIHSVFLVYRKLLEHIEKSTRSLSRKTTPWKRAIHDALLAAKQKLREYYDKTYRDHGFLYATGTMLAPQYKLSAFGDTEYSKCHSETLRTYRSYLRKGFHQYQQQIPDLSFCTTIHRSQQQTSELDQLLVPRISLPDDRNQLDEVDRYLQEGKALVRVYFAFEWQLTFQGIVPLPPRAYWKEHEHEFPVLSRLARDLLAVPATGAGVERLFNSARDICHYRRGSLHEKTIQDLMMHMCAQKFTLDSQQLSHLEKTIPMAENQVTREEELALKATEEEFDLISDCEEDEPDDMEEARVEAIELEGTEGEPEVTRIERLSRSVFEELDREDEGMSLLPPPLIQLRESSQKRSSGRVTVPSSRLQGYELY